MLEFYRVLGDLCILNSRVMNYLFIFNIRFTSRLFFYSYVIVFFKEFRIYLVFF